MPTAFLADSRLYLIHARPSIGPRVFMLTEARPRPPVSSHLCPLVRTGDRVEQLHDRRRVGRGLFQRRGQQRTGERPGVHVGPLGEGMQLRAMATVEPQNSPSLGSD